MTELETVVSHGQLHVTLPETAVEDLDPLQDWQDFWTIGSRVISEILGLQPLRLSRCPKVALSATARAAVVIYWRRALTLDRGKKDLEISASCVYLWASDNDNKNYLVRGVLHENGNEISDWFA